MTCFSAPVFPLFSNGRPLINGEKNYGLKRVINNSGPSVQEVKTLNKNQQRGMSLEDFAKFLENLTNYSANEALNKIKKLGEKIPCIVSFLHEDNTLFEKIGIKLEELIVGTLSQKVQWFIVPFIRASWTESDKN
tara:strand:- start:213 stop:617 length:405 start_codon:yes stop_codon:yes gene_type:complete